MLTITHTHEAGTIIDGTARGDGTAEVLKANGWRWGRSITAWYIPMSRDHRPKHHIIDRTAAALEAAGFEVERNLDESVRSAAEVEAGKIARQQARVDALDAKADRKQAAADAAWERHERDVARLPEGGEPIKVGHHSERRHRNAIDRAHTSARRGIDAQKEADRVAERADAAGHTTAARYSVRTVANRIDKIEADLRRAARAVDADVYDPEHGYRPVTAVARQARIERLAPKVAELRDQLAYWQGVRAEQVAAGTARDYGPDAIAKGDSVLVLGQWRRVVRVNPKSVSVETGFSHSARAAYADIQDHRRDDVPGLDL